MQWAMHCTYLVLGLYVPSVTSSSSVVFGEQFTYVFGCVSVRARFCSFTAIRYGNFKLWYLFSLNSLSVFFFVFFAFSQPFFRVSDIHSLYHSLVYSYTYLLFTHINCVFECMLHLCNQPFSNEQRKKWIKLMHTDDMINRSDYGMCECWTFGRKRWKFKSIFFLEIEKKTVNYGALNTSVSFFPVFVNDFFFKFSFPFKLGWLTCLQFSLQAFFPYLFWVYYLRWRAAINKT